MEHCVYNMLNLNRSKVSSSQVLPYVTVVARQLERSTTTSSSHRLQVATPETPEDLIKASGSKQHTEALPSPVYGLPKLARVRVHQGLDLIRHYQSHSRQSTTYSPHFLSHGPLRILKRSVLRKSCIDSRCTRLPL